MHEVRWDWRIRSGQERAGHLQESGSMGRSWMACDMVQRSDVWPLANVTIAADKGKRRRTERRGYALSGQRPSIFDVPQAKVCTRTAVRLYV